MLHSTRIGSMEELRQYLADCPQAGGEVLSLVRHLVCLQEQMEEALDRGFWLKESDAYQCAHLAKEAREFISKRIFAFLRKDMFPLLRENLAHFPPSASLPPDIALSILEFAPLPQDVCSCLEKLSQDSAPVKENDGALAEETCTEEVHEESHEAESKNAASAGVIPPGESQKEDHALAAGIATPGEGEAIASAEGIAPAGEGEAIGGLEFLEEATLKPIEHCKDEGQIQEAVEKAAMIHRCELEKIWNRFSEMKISRISLSSRACGWFSKLKNARPYRFPEVMQGVLVRCQDQKDRYDLMRLKSYVIQYGKMVSDASTLLAWIAFGKKKTEKMLQKLSNLTDERGVNQGIHEYLWWNLETVLTRHGQNFRRELERCRSRQELLCLMARYPLRDLSMVEQIPSLEIIGKVKIICDSIRTGEEVGRLFSRHLGMGEANMQRHLFRLLIADTLHGKLQQSIGEVSNVNQLLKELKKLRKMPETRHAADTLFQLIVTFLRRRSHISFQCLKISLNFLPPHLQEQILAPIRQKARRDLESQFQALLTKGRPEKRWKKLLYLLQNSKFHALDIKVFGYTPSQWLEKLSAVSASEGEIKKAVYHIFAAERVPHSLLELIVEIHKVRSRAKCKSVHGCYRELTKLKKGVHSGEILCLKRPLMDLFQIYGQVNFSHLSEEPLTGYAISRIIGKFYRDAQRETIALPENLQGDIAEILTAALSEERVRQLKKLRVN